MYDLQLQRKPKEKIGVSMTNLVPPDATADEGTTNDERASWAKAALLDFAKRTGMARDTLGDSEDLFLILADLLADLAHWSDRNNLNLQSAIQYATRHYRTETGGVGKQLP
jgi:hypothetical protein